MNQKQCKACPWLKSVTPQEDIPGGYCERKHRGLKSTIAEPGTVMLGGTLRAMACHETAVGAERRCVGWVHNQLGRGNNIQLRLMAMRDKSIYQQEVIGPQHERFEDTLPE